MSSPADGHQQGLAVVHPAGLEDGGQDAGDVPQGLPHRLLDLLLVAAALLLFLQLDVDAHVADRPGVPGADGGVGVLDLRDFLEGGQDRRQPVPGLVDGGVRARS